jgi:hypothetical protein
MSKYSNITDSTLVIVNVTKPLYLYNIVEAGDGQEELNSAIESKKEEAKTWRSHIANYPDCKEKFGTYLKEAIEARFAICTMKEYEDRQRKYYLDMPLQEITEEVWDDMLNVLPPLQWVTINGVNEFLMSEFMSGPYTSQYARKEGKYYTKIVDAYDKTTWIHNLI